MRASLLLLLLLAGVTWAGNPITQALPNDLRVITQPTTSAQVVSVTAVVDFSALDEPREYAGMRAVLVTSMLYGSAEMDGVAIRKKLALYGGVLEGRVHQDALEFTVRIPAGATGVALRALSEILTRPALNDEAIEVAIAQAERAITTPPVGALQYAREVSEGILYRDHPYTSRGRGTGYGLSHLTAPIIRWAYHTYVTPRTTVLAIVGRYRVADTTPIVNEAFGKWASRAIPPRGTWEQPVIPQSSIELREGPQSGEAQ